jgi:glycosyltransferase involved in cell wall biosynthesis
VSRPRVVLLRGHLANPWDLLPWERLTDRFDVSVVITGSNLHGLRPLDLRTAQVRALSDWIPPGRLRDFWAGAPFNRYVGLDEELAGAAIVHAAELGTWFTAEAARRKEKHGYKLVLTVWETIPFLDAYRRRISWSNRRRAAAAADLFLPTTERARKTLLLEGVPETKIEVAPPGIAIESFRSAALASTPALEHVIVSPGRLVWEKGHQDVLRAVAALHRGLVETPARPRLLMLGAGPEEGRLRKHARELGIEDVVEFRSTVSYDEMPSVYASASCMVLASLPTRSWEEQFGMVLVEAMAAGLPIVTSESGAIPEVAGESSRYFPPGDWLALARELTQGPLARPPGTRVSHPEERLARYSSDAAAERFARAYEGLLER